MEHSNSYTNLGPYDLILFEHDSNQILVAAMGTGGVLVKTNDSSWESIGVGYAGPMLPYESKNIAEAISALSTELVFISITSIVLLFFNILVNTAKSDSKGFILLIVIGVITIISFILVAFSFIGFLPSIIYIIGMLAFLLCASWTILLLFHQLLTNTNKQGIAGFIMLITAWLMSCTLFVFWAFRTIPIYETALWGAITLNVACLGWIIYRFITRIIQQRLPENS